MLFVQCDQMGIGMTIDDYEVFALWMIKLAAAKTMRDGFTAMQILTWFEQVLHYDREIVEAAFIDLRSSPEQWPTAGHLSERCRERVSLSGYAPGGTGIASKTLSASEIDAVKKNSQALAPVFATIATQATQGFGKLEHVTGRERLKTLSDKRKGET